MKPIIKAFVSTVEGQMALNNHAQRVGVLMALNTTVRKLNPADAWADAYILSLKSEQIDGTMEELRQCYNRLLEAKKAV